MSTIKSELQTVNAPAEKIFSLLSNFNNFRHLMPPQITNWQSTEDVCSFNIQGMADIGMRMKEKTPYRKITIASTGTSKLDFDLIISLKDFGNNQTETQLVFEASLNPMMGMMVTKPLTNFVNILNQQIKLVCEAV